jgi:1-deoxy-D-xylulose-5-phosphate reductoisomerase
LARLPERRHERQGVEGRVTVSGTTASPRSVTVLGATGSVGKSTLDLIGADPEHYRVLALTANRDALGLARAAKAHKAQLAVVADAACYQALKSELAGSGIEAAAGEAALIEAAGLPADWVMSAIVGATGLAPTLAAVRRGAMVAFANKECLVAAGALFMAAVRAHKATLLPVDSEHNAIFQALHGGAARGVERLVLTASGGPFREASKAAMAAATPEQAVAHPKWDMGAKISVDSATMMNKGLELIEAHHLFDMPADRLEVLIHPESIVHSLVGFEDGSMLAQLGVPDMRIPIAHTLGWPGRIRAATPRLDLGAVARLTFTAPDPDRFPALDLARQALGQGGAAPTILNAANEVAVAAFLDRRIGFLDIQASVARVLEQMPHPAPDDLDAVMTIDREARQRTATLLDRRPATVS